MPKNYQKQLDEILNNLSGTPRLLLHACCAPCASYVLEYLTAYFDITLFFFNPNINDPSEYAKRKDELVRLVNAMPKKNKIDFMESRYDVIEFETLSRGFEGAPEGGLRCGKCFYLRMNETALKAAANGFDYFASTLSISPHKNAELLNQISEECSARHGVKNLPCDFKKRGGYQRSIELSKQYNLYRQNFCGCSFSRLNRD